MGKGTGNCLSADGKASGQGPGRFLPYGRQAVDEEDIAAVVEVLRSDWLTCGPAVERFESELAAACGAEHAVAASNGTAALHLAMMAAGVGPGDRVLTCANTFLASANAAEYVGAAADFADMDPETRCMSLETLKAAWKPDVKAVVAVDYAGYPCATKEMAEYVHRRGAILVEDACHAIGSARDGYKVGGLPWVDMTIFSFHPVKTLTTGEGGAILARDKGLADSCRKNRSHGMERPMPGEKAERPYAMERPGYNYRLTDLQCALGIAQLRKLGAFVSRRRQIVDRYNRAFEGLPHVKTPRAPGETSVAWHLYALGIDFAELGTSREEVAGRLKAEGIGTQIHYYPVHLQPYYAKKYGYGRGKCPAAEGWYEKALSLPLFPGMGDDEVQRTIEAVGRALRTGGGGNGGARRRRLYYL